jgi:Hint module
MAKMIATALLVACGCASLAAATSLEVDQGASPAVRVFNPVAQKNVKFFKASAALTAPDCPSYYIEMQDTKEHPTVKGTYVVPHSLIVADGVRCGKTGQATEYLWLIPSTLLLDAKSADLGGVRQVYDTLKTNARFSEAFSKLISVDPLFIGIDMGDRHCGDKVMWPRNSGFIYVQAENKVINFGALGWIAPGENGMLGYQTPVDGARSVLCIYKDSVKPGPSATPLPSPPPFPAVSGAPANPFGIFPGIDPTPSPVPTPPPAVPSPAAKPSPAASSTPSPKAASCFPAAAKVETEAGVIKRMDQLAVGDRVRVGPSEFSTVFMFTHKLGGEDKREFVRIDVASGDSITATAGHYLFAGGSLKTAASVRAGDSLTLATGALSTVTEVSRVLMSGLYNPQTEDGRIVVDGIVASTYTQTVHPSVAHALLAPLRFMYRMGALPQRGLFHGGNHGLAALVPEGASTC